MCSSPNQQIFTSSPENQLTQQDMEIFGAICSVDQLEIMQGGIVQAETATVMMMFDEELQTTSTPPTGKLLILLCRAV